jgi:seryl-tRNA synthetase
MIDIHELRTKGKEIEKKLQTKDRTIHLSPILVLDEEVRKLILESETLQAKRNLLSKEIGLLKQKGQDAESKLLEVAVLGETIGLLEKRLHLLKQEFNDLLARLPNIPSEEIPVGQDPKENMIIKEAGVKRVFSFKEKNHLELNEKLKLFDLERAAKVSGSSFPAYRGVGAELEWALINYMIQVNRKNGYLHWMPPLLVRKEMLYNAGQLPKFDNQQFKLDDEDYPLYLIPTAEVVLNGLHAGEIIPFEELPLRYMAYTPCFRREAGAHGSNERGLIRTHQFNKVEMFCFCAPDKSEHEFDLMVKNAEKILDGLNLHYRNALLVTGDMSFAAAKTIDVEVYLPGQGRYYEVSSISNCTDYQARRSLTRFRRKNEKPELVHTLNGSGLATSRLMVALLENNQQEDGSVIIPQALRPFMENREILEPV